MVSFVFAQSFALAFVVLSALYARFRGNINMFAMETPLSLEIAHVPGYFVHEAQKTGPESGFRAVRRPRVRLAATTKGSRRPHQLWDSKVGLMRRTVLSIPTVNGPNGKDLLTTSVT